MDNEDEFAVSKKLADISLAMSDAYHFIHVRTLLEDWDRLAKNGDKTAQSAMVMFDQFYNVCNHVLTKGK